MPDEVTLETWLNHLRNAVVLAAPDGDVLYANAAFHGLFGRRAAPNAVNLFDLLKDNPVILESVRRVLEIRGIYYLREIPVKGAGPSDKAMDVETFPIVGAAGELSAVSVVFYDRAVRAQLQEHEKRTERINYFGMIASGLAHEIKNPLSGIKGASQLLVEELGNKRRQGRRPDVPAGASNRSHASAQDTKKLQKANLKEYAEIILNETVRVDRLLKDLLNFTKPRKLHKKKVNVNQVLHDQILLQKTVDQDGVEIVGLFDPSLPKITADPEALTQVFLNLIKNSRQAITGAGKAPSVGIAGGASPSREHGSLKGRVTIRTRVVTDFGLRRKEKKSQVIAVDVEDTGEGIDEKVLPNIFAPFFTTKPKGTGLGLALCHRIVEEHGGDIEVKSERGKGTVFSVYLPV